MSKEAQAFMPSRTHAKGALPGAVKLVALVWRKPELTHEEFVEYYERTHLPLIRKLLPFKMTHQRTYVRPDTEARKLAVTVNSSATFDVVTQVWFDDMETLEAMLARQQEPEIAIQMAADEERFADRDRTIVFLGDERTSTLGASAS